MEYKGKIKISKDKANWINKILFTEPEDEDECFGEDETYTEEYVFENGMRICIDICGVQYDEDEESNLPYTQAVLYDKNCEIECSEPCEDFFGEWELETDDDVYIVEIEEE